MEDRNDWTTVTPAARTLKLSEQSVRKLADNGTLKAIRLPGGQRLIDAQSVEEVAKEREKQKQGK